MPTLNQRLDLDFALQAAGLGVWEYDAVTQQINWDDRCRQLFGLARDSQMSYEQAFQYIHADDIARVEQAAQGAMDPQSDGVFDQTYRTIGADDGQLRWVRFQGQVSFTQAGEINRFAGVAQDVTQQVIAQQALEHGQQQVLNSFEQAPFAVAALVGPELTYQMANALYRQLVGRSSGQLLGRPLLEAIPEVEGQGFVDLLQQVIATGVPYEAKRAPYQIHHQHGIRTAYFDFTYQPWQKEGQTVGVMIVAVDVTQQVMDSQKIEDSETKLRSLIAAAPAGIGLFVGRDLIIENPNQTFIDIVGKGPTIEGLPLREAMPELLTEGQPFLNILDDVFTTGVPFISPASLVKIVQNGVLNDNYYNISYTPVYNAAGQPYAILDIAIDVTAQVKAQQALAESEAALRDAIELAGLGTWRIDVPTGQVTYSERLQSWLGISGMVWGQETAQRIHPDDRKRVSQAIAKALEKGDSGRYDEEYTIIHAQTGQERIIHASGQTSVDSEGNPLTLAGTAQDVTLEREMQLTLEQQVQARTEELTELNQLLTRSNENLQQFAYITSHDLQEPLRKIQTFAEVLKKQYPEGLGQGVDILERMQVAAGRMSALIRDLLTFSRVSGTQQEPVPVALTQVVEMVLYDLELVISETSAQITVEPLPTVDGDKAQLGQLFQNLVANALKFRQPGVPPLITIRCQPVAAAALPASVHPTQQVAAYHQIEVIDNGIGFDPRYVDRIFQVFQQLHGRSQYLGTGIGLAICEKVAANHGGAITATSQPGAGATFSLYLPIIDSSTASGRPGQD